MGVYVQDEIERETVLENDVGRLECNIYEENVCDCVCVLYTC